MSFPKTIGNTQKKYTPQFKFNLTKGSASGTTLITKAMKKIISSIKLTSPRLTKRFAANTTTNVTPTSFNINFENLEIPFSNSLTCKMN